MNKLAKILTTMVLFLPPACLEYELEVIKPEATPGPIHFLDTPDHRRLPPQKDPSPPDGPVDMGPPLIPDIEVSFLQYDFGTQELTDPPTDTVLEIGNTGDYPLRISQIAQTSVSNSFLLGPFVNNELFPGEIESLIINYKPTVHGPDASILKIDSNDPDEPSVIILLAANGATPKLEISPLTVDFGSVDPLNAPASLSVNLTNVGDGLIEISSIQELKANLDINISSYPSTKLTPGQNTTMQLSYLPTDSGKDVEKIEVVSNDPANSVQKITVKARTADPDIEAPPLIDFGTIELGTSLVKSFDIENLGDGKLHVSGVSFPQSTGTFNLKKTFAGYILPGSSETLEIEYLPDDYTPDSSNLQVVSNDPVDPIYTVSLLGASGIPEIEVDPLAIDFGSVDVYAPPPTEKIKISNVGTGNLTLAPVSLKHNTVFSWSLPVNSLPPGSSTHLQVLYTPVAFAPDSDEVRIGSNDPNNPLILVPIDGFGSAPRLEIHPDPHDYGTEYLECDREQIIDLKNVGDVDLEISKLEYFTSFPSHFSIDYDLVSNGQFPWTISAGSQNSVFIEYLPLLATIDSSFLKVTSNDPLSPSKISYQYGEGVYYSSVIDTHVQDTVMMSDILFVIDNSCSMGSWQTDVAANFDSFITVFQSSGVDYHIAIITTDSPYFVGSIIDNLTVDPITEFTAQAQVGIYGSGHERGLDMAYEALSPGGDAAPGSAFERTDAKMSVIFVSDEPDYSYELAQPLDYSSFFKTAKVSSSRIVSHSVSGDCPSGCSTPYTSNGYTYSKYASCNYDYIDVVTDMGGSQLSLCAADWGLKMETLAKDSITRSSFELSDTPIASTIEVLVDGTITGNWTYDPVINSVVFDPASIPLAGSIIDISYNILGGC